MRGHHRLLRSFPWRMGERRLPQCAACRDAVANAAIHYFDRDVHSDASDSGRSAADGAATAERSATDQSTTNEPAADEQSADAADATTAEQSADVKLG